MLIQDVPLIFTAEEFVKANNAHIKEYQMPMSGDLITEWVQHTYDVDDMYELGSGCYSQVFEHPTHDGYVIKISHHEDGEKDACIDYILAIQDRTEPWFPRVGQISSFENTYVIILEKLAAFNHSNIVSDEDEPVSPYMESVYDNIINFIVCDCHMSQQPLDNIIKEYTKRGATLSMIEEYLPMMYSCWELFLNLRASLFYNEDIHEGNVMLRGNQIVITDPIC